MCILIPPSVIFTAENRVTDPADLALIEAAVGDAARISQLGHDLGGKYGRPDANGFFVPMGEWVGKPARGEAGALVAFVARYSSS
jgi:hypothetical protein